ncbi:electron transfer flavoprotein subunit alpha/FixB family protein [Actinomyces minihominis]|uniref:electron transfer flavoprotein subunit alpha/FixB family protein n=1 Tax=Actinomyces minihominis TaxID=2002838 RepID=UPI000C07836F|nr:electron transfer flavoprotein subunit alpha/FixB family protein [Actinomyces minihominis]
MELITQPILVLVENDRTESVPTLSAASSKLLHLASTLTEGPVVALSVSPEVDEEGCRAGGAQTVYVPQASGYSPAVPAAVADVARIALTQLGNSGAVLTTSNYLGRAVTAMLSATSAAGGAVDVSSLRVDDGRIVAEKSALGGSWATAFHVTHGFPVLALNSGVGPDEGPAGEGVVVPIAAELSPGALGVEVVSTRSEPKGTRISLGDADVVVVGGRGVDGDFTLVEQLADALGGAVGATRVACDEGWVERSAQIGQTGVTVAPKLYIGLGVSGAVHHTCGMLGSEVIVAVVDDPDAPILELADFAVVGDLNEVVPQLLETFEQLG